MQSVVIDSVTYLLNLNLPNIDSVAMENYDYDHLNTPLEMKSSK